MKLSFAKDFRLYLFNFCLHILLLTLFIENKNQVASAQRILAVFSTPQRRSLVKSEAILNDPISAENKNLDVSNPLDQKTDVEFSKDVNSKEEGNNSNVVGNPKIDADDNLNTVNKNEDENESKEKSEEKGVEKRKTEKFIVNGRNIEVINVKYNETRMQGESQCDSVKPCKPGLILPVWLPQEMSFKTRMYRAFVYFLAMIYLFYGVSIVSDRFMAAIEVITSHEREVTVKKITGEKTNVLVHVWNETVSNLTLMALGSSAPEILLSIIEIVGNNFEAGDLGPSTIVGSAAFNLFVIVAICIQVVPSNEVRRIKRVDVFWITVAFSTFAYIWLYLILSVISPNVVEVWEGVLTFLFFPLTVGCAFLTSEHLPSFGKRFISNKGVLSMVSRSTPVMGAPRGQKAQNGKSKQKTDVESALLGNDSFNEVDRSRQNRQNYLKIFQKIRANHPDLSLAELEQVAATTLVKETPKSRAFYRVQATRMMTGSGNILAKNFKTNTSNDSKVPLPLMPIKPKEVVVGFTSVNILCLENVGTIKLGVYADRGSLKVQTKVTVKYKTIADSAQEHEDFIPVEGTLIFQPNETEKFIKIAIVDNDVYEEDEQFFVNLFDLKAFVSTNTIQKLPSKIDPDGKTATVIIVDDDHAGAFSFKSETFYISESKGTLTLEVRRHRGARGVVTVPYKTIDGTAKDGSDYIGHDGELRFEDGQIKSEIKIEIINDDEYEKSEEFYVELGEPAWHVAKNDFVQNGSPILGAHKRCRITITEDNEFKSFVDKMLVEASTSFMVGSSSWKNQFKEALKPEDINGDGVLSTKEKILHYISLPWKLIFALVPPTDYYHGWLSFIVAIIAIGILTAIIGDVAAMFGCTVQLKGSVTAITLVAIGTSMPDTFASKTAAIQDQTADSSIGNVTGSNAVNVFLGIGVAWAIAAIYHSFHGRQFYVDAGSLASNVFLFLIGSFFCFVVLQYRHYNSKIKGEFGGPTRSKAISITIFLSIWIIYVSYTTLVAYCIVPGF